MSEQCDACGEEVRLAGGIANIWSSEPIRTGGMTLEFDDVQESRSDSCSPSEAQGASEDGTEHFLCFDCIEELPDDPDAADVDALEE